MSELKEPKPAKVITGLLISPSVNQQECFEMLFRHFGDIDFISESIQFDYSKYYEPEMGTGLKKLFYSFANLINPEQIVDVKLQTNEIEELLSEQGRRKVNLDPGYLAPAKVVLATTKNFDHRIYLGKGIYGDVQLRFRKKKFHFNNWTYPDYKDMYVIEFLTRLRSLYMK